MAPFRKAFVFRPFVFEREARWQIVTGYLGVHCAHELVGRSNKDRASTKLDWLAAVVNADGQVVSQAYVSVINDDWLCPVSGKLWQALVDSLAQAFIRAVVVPSAH
ncbi:MAG TPA: hypothetical protein VIV60_33570, partial [Polyangiaceae bacterium]